MPTSPAIATIADLGPALGVDLRVPWFDVRNRQFAGGAKGDGVTDDTAAFQAAANAAIAASGTLLIPPTPNSYVISSTINLVPAGAGLQFHLDIAASALQEGAGGGQFAAILWNGGNNTSIFKSLGWKRSQISGIQIRIPTNKSGVVAWDIDHDTPRSSTSLLNFCGCRVTVSGTPAADHVGWRMGHTSAVSGELSFLNWYGCSVECIVGYTGNPIGWVNEDPNGLSLQWYGCTCSTLKTAWSTTSTPGAGSPNGGGSMFWYGCGCSQTEIDFDLTGSNYLISGGRFELGKRFIQLASGTSPNTVICQNVNIATYSPADGQIFRSDRPGCLILDNCYVNRNGGGGADYDLNMIRLSVGGGLPATCFVRGGCYQADDPFFFSDGTKTLMVVESVNKVTTNGIVTGSFSERRGLTATPAVASAATIAVPVGAELVNVTGTTTITSVAAGYVNQRVTLVFAGILTFTDGSNLKLAGNFVTTADDTISLICDGTNWIEIARSVN
jgi:hypothetical protein